MILSLIITTAIAFAQTYDPADLVELIDQANQLCTRGVPEGECADSAGDGSSLEVERREITDHLGNKLTVSVISEDSLRALRDLYPPFLAEMDPGLCVPRAHTIGDKLAREGIETAKLVTFPGGIWPFTGSIVPDEKTRWNGPFRPYWKFHVANIIYVKTRTGQVEEYVIDPFLEGLPVPRAHWEKRIRTHPASSVGQQMYVSRFNWGPTDYGRKVNAYDEELLSRAYRYMNGSLKMVE